MPRVRTCTLKIGEAEFTSHLNVASSGEFSIRLPGNQTDWPDSIWVRGKEAKEVETRWAQKVREFASRSTTTRQVLVVLYDSTLRAGGPKGSVFHDRNNMLRLQACVAIETTTMQGGVPKVSYKEHPDYDFTKSPFPVGMRFRLHELSHLRESITIVDWSQHVQDAIARACEGIVRVVDMLHDVLETPDTLVQASSSLLRLGDAVPAPKVIFMDTGVAVGVDDMDGQPMRIGDYVLIYAREYETKSIEQVADGIPIIEEDVDSPKPVLDRPLCSGQLVWSPEDLTVKVEIIGIYVKWEVHPAAMRICTHSYAYQVVKEKPAPGLPDPFPPP